MAIRNIIPICRGAGNRNGASTIATSPTLTAAKNSGGTPPSVTVHRVTTRLSAHIRHTAKRRAKSAGFIPGPRPGRLEWRTHDADLCPFVAQMTFAADAAGAALQSGLNGVSTEAPQGPTRCSRLAFDHPAVSRAARFQRIRVAILPARLAAHAVGEGEENRRQGQQQADERGRHEGGHGCRDEEKAEPGLAQETAKPLQGQMDRAPRCRGCPRVSVMMVTPRTKKSALGESKVNRRG